MNVETALEIDGVPPQLASLRCEELICEQYWYRGVLDEPANVVYLRFGSRWHRLTFDHGIVFWRTQKERPAPYSMHELEAEVRLDDLGARLGLAGCVLVSYETHVVEGGSAVAFRFESGVSVEFRSVGDHTVIIS